MNRTVAAAVAALVLGTAAGTAVYAARPSNDENDAIADRARARITLVQAIATAEQSAGGRATRAELEHERAGLVYEVEVADAAAQSVTDVQVDGITGKVLKSTPDRIDRRGKGDDEGGDR
jgi:uncharacterized membrane protein YkoI